MLVAILFVSMRLNGLSPGTAQTIQKEMFLARLVIGVQALCQRETGPVRARFFEELL